MGLDYKHCVTNLPRYGFIGEIISAMRTITGITDAEHLVSIETDYKNNYFAPYVKDCPIQIGMKYVEEYDIKSNNTKLIVGEIQELYIEEKLIKEDGFVNLSEGNIATINGLNGYAIPTLKERFEYQRPIK